jgi:hypothetical protein
MITETIYVFFSGRVLLNRRIVYFIFFEDNFNIPLLTFFKMP